MKIYKTKKYNSYIHLDIITEKKNPEFCAICTETQCIESGAKRKKQNHT